jgi:starch-binding outer membrane protein, SusD/RagB family
MKNIKLLALSCVFLVVASCTNLEETVYDQIPAADFGKTADQVAAQLGPAYANLRDYSWNIYNTEVTTDVITVPTRGSDWYDGGEWLAFGQHTMGPTHGPTGGIWSWGFGGIGRVNSLFPIVKGNVVAESELRAVRAYYYYLMVDIFGNVPIITESSTDNSTKARAEVTKFIESELKASMANLSDNAGGAYYGRANKWMANMILAKIYLNWNVFTGEAAKTSECIAACDAVINSGKYAFSGDFFDNFKVANETSTENIFVIPYDKNKGQGMNLQMRTLHYANKGTYNLADTPWNGFCSMAEFYNTFKDGDARKNMWLVGQQYAADGSKLKDSQGADLAFDPVITKDFMTAADPEYQRAGARFKKYEIQKNNPSVHQDNDMVIFRLSDAHMMRAEANFRAGKAADGLVDVNKIRARAGAPAWSTSDMTLDNLLEERGREFATEAMRRQDLIRFGKFESATKFVKGKDLKYRLYPIPQSQIDANPKLKQNPGY